MEELIKLLRELASIPEHCENVADCAKCTKEDICLSFTNKRIIEVATQAADAIEELAAFKAQITDGRFYVYKLGKLFELKHDPRELVVRHQDPTEPPKEE